MFDYAVHAEAIVKASLESELINFGKRTDIIGKLMRMKQLIDLDQIRQVVKDVIHERAHVSLFGSFVSGFSDETSDIDATVCLSFPLLNFAVTGSNQVMFTPLQLCSLAVKRIADYVTLHSYLNISVVHLIPSAKVPVVTLRGPSGSIFDLSVNNELPLFNTALLKCYARADERVRILVLCVKRWAKLADVTGAKAGNLSSYSWTLLCIYYLQVCYQPMLNSLQAAASAPQRVFTCPLSGRKFSVGFSTVHAQIIHSHSMGDLLRGFFVFYDSCFEWGREVVSIRYGARLPLSAYPDLRGKPGYMHIEDPIDVEKNLNCVLDSVGEQRLRQAISNISKQLVHAPAMVLLQHARLVMGHL